MGPIQTQYYDYLLHMDFYYYCYVYSYVGTTFFGLLYFVFALIQVYIAAVIDFCNPISDEELDVEVEFCL